MAISIARVKDPAPGYLDAVGCVKSQNDIAVELNKQMKAEVVKLRAELSDAALVYVDMYKAKYDLIANAKTEGDRHYDSSTNYEHRMTEHHLVFKQTHPFLLTCRIHRSFQSMLRLSWNRV